MWQLTVTYGTVGMKGGAGEETERLKKYTTCALLKS